jgi:membrane dipeptidase
MEMARRPMIFSHSNAFAIHGSPRNIRDDQIRACARAGGIIGVTGLDSFLGPDHSTSVDLLVRHIDHMSELVGPEHVALGLDYCGDDDMQAVQAEAEERPLTYTYTAETLPLFMPPESLPELVESLLHRDYSDSDVRGILGGNFLRVVENVWR